MKPSIKLLLMASICNLIVHDLISQDQFSVEGEFRFNPLFSNGFRVPQFEDDRPEGYMNQRSRLILSFNRSNDLTTKFVFQDLRAWGTYRNNGPAGNLSVFRAWVEKKITDQLSVKFGRQGFIYDDSRILGGLNWGGNMAHDAALLKYEKNGLKVHAALAYNANGFDFNREPFEFANHKHMQFLWTGKKFNNLDFSLIFLNRGLEKPDNSLSVRNEQTAGGNLSWKLNSNISLKGTYYYQFGTDTVGTGRSIDAFFYNARLMVKPTSGIRFTLGLDVVSGGDMDDQSEKNNFDILYGLRHGYYGYIDYFYVRLWPETGLRNYYLKTNIKTGQKSSLDIHLHSFFSDGNVISADGTSNLESYYGSEVDFKWNYKVDPDTKMTLAYSYMGFTDSYTTYYSETRKGGASALYAVITIKPTFFKSDLEKHKPSLK